MSKRENERNKRLAVGGMEAVVLVSKDLDRLRMAARAVCEAWDESEIGQIDGDLIERLREAAGTTP